MEKKQTNKNFQQGQTIAELLIACFIILIGLAAILTASISILNTVSVSKDIVIATNLAREGLEVIRNKRDNNWLSGAIFDDGLNFDQSCATPPCDGNIDDSDRKSVTKILVSQNSINTTTSAIQIGTGHDQIETCGANCLLKINTDIYYHTAGDKTKFSRLITLTPICNDQAFPLNNPFPTVDISCDDGAIIQPKIGIKAEAQVGWLQKGNWRVVTLREYLYDWKLP